MGLISIGHYKGLCRRESLVAGSRDGKYCNHDTDLYGHLGYSYGFVLKAPPLLERSVTLPPASIPEICRLLYALLLRTPKIPMYRIA